ncbi:MAG: hypothetical protein V3V99_11595 [candidate division Zixibacteria bacterium]
MQSIVIMTVAFDLSKFEIFRNGDLFYPGVASLLAIVHCGGRAILYNSQGTTTRQEKKLIDKLTTSFGGKIVYARDAGNADMSIN